MVAWLLIQSDEEDVDARDGLVTQVVDGDTLRAQVGASIERVRLIGIDAPERGECYFAHATELLRAIAQGEEVELLGDSSQRERDRFDRLLAYVVLPDGTDTGRVLLAGGAAVVFETRPPFARHDEYTDAAADAERRGAGLHGACR